MDESKRESALRAATEDPAEDSVAKPATEPVTEAPAEAGAKPDIDEVKRKFREALDAKRQARTERNAAGGRDAGRIHGTHGPVGGKRSFRRKSG